MENIYSYNTLIGTIWIAENENNITMIHAQKQNETIPEEQYQIKETDVIKQAAKQLNEYLEGKRKEFDLPLKPKGTRVSRKSMESIA